MIGLTGTIRSVARPRKDASGEPMDQRKQIVCTESWVAMVDEWCKRQPGRAPTFSDAVRYLTLRGMRADDIDKQGKGDA
jgi:hypothetical protein